MKKLGWKIALLAVAVVIGGGLYYASKLSGEAKANDNAVAEGAIEKPNHVRVVKVSVLEIQPTPLKDVLMLPGETKPWKDITLASDQEGRVEQVDFREGDRVSKGDLIAKIDVSQLKAQLDNARANYKLADSLYQRRSRLFARKIISQEDLDQARTQRVVAAGTLRQARVAYEHGLVHAPIDGAINHLYVEQGEFVQRGGAVADIVDFSQIKVEVSVPELDVKYLEPGAPAMFQVDALPGDDFGAVIDFVAVKADSATKTFLVRVLVANKDGKIRPGMMARVAFLRRVVPDAIVIPLFSLVDKGGERIVYVVEDGVAKARSVSLGVIDRDKIQIVEGLNPGDKLIVAGQNDVQEGTKVQVEP